MGTIEEMIRILDDKLLESGKPYLTLSQANNELVSKELLSISEKSNNEFKKLLEMRLIPNSSQTNATPRQWRIYLSDAGKKRREKYIPKTHSKKTNADESTIKGINSIDQQQRKWAIGCVVFIIIFLLIVIIPKSPKNIRELQHTYNGKDFSDYYYNYFNDTYGPGKPLYFHSQKWIYYYPKGDFTMTVSKRSNRILDFYDGIKNQ